jgi:hypothetical protein
MAMTAIVALIRIAFLRFDDTHAAASAPAQRVGGRPPSDSVPDRPPIRNTSVFMVNKINHSL